MKEKKPDYLLEQIELISIELLRSSVRLRVELSWVGCDVEFLRKPR